MCEMWSICWTRHCGFESEFNIKYTNGDDLEFWKDLYSEFPSAVDNDYYEMVLSDIWYDFSEMEKALLMTRGKNVSRRIFGLWVYYVSHQSDQVAFPFLQCTLHFV